MNQLNRLQRLESQLQPSSGLVIGIPIFGPEGELIAYRIGDDLVARDNGEDRRAFEARVRATREMDIIVLFGGKDDIDL